MNYPIVQIETSDGLCLHGLFLHEQENKSLFLHVHGTGSNFYEEYFVEVMSQKLIDSGISLLSTNNRGTGVYDAYQGSGAAIEKFEDCVLDIDAWIQFALDNHFERIILSGHSLGTEKVVYYMNNGKYADRVSHVVLLAPADSYGSHRMRKGKDNTQVRENVEKFLEESSALLKKGNGDVFLARSAYGSHSGIMPKTAESFFNFLGPESKLLQGLPFVTRKLEAYGKITLPILVVIGDQEEYTGIPTAEALELMKRENSNTIAIQLSDCNHDFEGCEDRLTEEILSFLK